jgi:hypothetical protein
MRKSHKIHTALGDVSYVTTGFSSESVTLGEPFCIDSSHFFFLLAFGRWPVPISTRLQATVTVFLWFLQFSVSEEYRLLVITCNTHKEDDRCIHLRDFSRKSETKSYLIDVDEVRHYRYGHEVNNCECMQWINLPQDRVYRRALVNTGMNQF